MMGRSIITMDMNTIRKLYEEYMKRKESPKGVDIPQAALKKRKKPKS